MTKKGTILLVRAAALALCFLSVHRAFAGVYTYRAERALQLRNYEQAFRFSEKGLRIHAFDPDLLYLHTQSGWSRGRELQNASYFEKSEQALRKFLTQIPFFGRAWLYQAWLTLALRPEAWQEARDLLQKACRLDPSAWVLFNASRIFLERRESLSLEEKNQALLWMIAALHLHDSNQPSAYLKPGLTLLWKAFQDPAILEQAVTEDIFSYDILNQFLASKGLVKEREARLSKTEKLRRENYDAQCRKAEDLLKRGYLERAYAEFQIASWMDNTRVYAEAGMIASRYPKKMLLDVEKTLVKISEDHQENWEFLKPRLKDAFKDYGLKDE